MRSIACLAAVLTMMFAAGWGNSSAVGAETEPLAIAEAFATQYETAFNAGDAKALAAMFAEDVEFTDGDGELTQGRADVEDLISRNLVRNAGARLDIQIESARALGEGVIAERGVTAVTSKQGELSSTAYTLIYTKQGSDWKISQLVESPIPVPAPSEMLSQLGWMVGTWEEKDGDADIRTAVSWAEGGNFLTRNFKVMINDEVTLQGFQIIGWDAAEETIRSWMFDSEGAHMEGTWTRSGDSWLIRQVGVLPDGSKLSTESTLKRVDSDTCTWDSTNRTLDGDPQPNLPSITMKRVSATK